jgi:hypothetical protein
MMRECFDEGVLQSYCDGELSSTRAESVAMHLAQCTSCSALTDELIGANDIVFAALTPEFQAAVPTERLRQRIDDAISGVNVSHVAQPSIASRTRDWFASLGSLFTLRPQTLSYAGLAAVLLFAAIFGVVYFKSTPQSTESVARVDKPDAPKANANQPEKQPTPTRSSAVDPGPAPEVPKPSPTPLGTNNARPRPTRHSLAPLNETVAKVKLLPGERSYLKTIAALDSTIKAGNDKPMRPELRAEYERNLALVDKALAAARSAAKNNPDDPDAAEFVFAAYQSKVDLMNTVADARVYNRRP